MIAPDTYSRLRKGDGQAFEEVVNAYQHEMLCIAARIIGHQPDAEEVRQRILIRIWQTPSKLPSVEYFEAWLRRCVVNESISLIRQRKRHDLLTSKLTTSCESDSTREADSDAEQLQIALNQIEPEQRALLSLRFDRQLTVREIGQVLERSHTTIQSQLDRAIARLRSFMQNAMRK